MTHAFPIRRPQLAAEPLEARDVPSAYDLGEASQFNALFLSDMDAFNSDAEGRVAAGGHLSLQNYGIGDKLLPDNTRDDLIAGHDLDFTNGQVFGGNIVYGDVGNLKGVGTPNGGVRQQADLLPVADIAQDLAAKSVAWGAEGPNGKTYVRYSSLHLTGKHPQLDVFTVTPEQLATAKSIKMVTPFGATVLINVPGGVASLQNLGLSLRGAEAGHVLWNFYQADQLSVSGVGLEGSVLAPAAHLDFNNGQITGTVVTRSMAGNGQFNLTPVALHIEFRRDSSLAGQVFMDADANDQKGPDETGLNGVEVALTGRDTLGRTVSLATLSAGDGNFNFGPLMAGTYAVRVVPPQRYGETLLDGIPGTVGGALVGTGAVNRVTTIGLADGDDGIDYLLPLVPTLN
jgi:choice-of-anchor A domain-containing protein